MNKLQFFNSHLEQESKHNLYGFQVLRAVH